MPRTTQNRVVETVSEFNRLKTMDRLDVKAVNRAFPHEYRDQQLGFIQEARARQIAANRLPAVYDANLKTVIRAIFLATYETLARDGILVSGKIIVTATAASERFKLAIDCMRDMLLSPERGGRGFAMIEASEKLVLAVRARLDGTLYDPLAYPDVTERGYDVGAHDDVGWDVARVV